MPLLAREGLASRALPAGPARDRTQPKLLLLWVLPALASVGLVGVRGTVTDSTRDGWGTVTDSTRDGWGTVTDSTRDGWGTVADSTRDGWGTVTDSTRQ